MDEIVLLATTVFLNLDIFKLAIATWLFVNLYNTI